MDNSVQTIGDKMTENINHMVHVTFEGVACADCACVIANGDDTGVHDDDRAEWEQGMEDQAAEMSKYGQAVIACSGEDSSECDSAREDTCDHCGRTVWGYFHKLVYLH